MAVVRVFVIITTVFFCLMSLVLGVTNIDAHTQQTSPCFTSNPGSGSSSPLSLPPPTPGVIVINEVLPFPHSHWNCASHSTSFSDDAWIELYNASNQAFSLYHYSIFLDGGASSGQQHYYFAPGAAIAPHGYYVVFPQIPLLEPRLFIQNTVVDSVSLPSVMPLDQSYARVPDGSTRWQILSAPTIGQSNVVVPMSPASRTHTHTPAKKSAKASSVKTKASHSSGNSQASSARTQSGKDVQQPSWTALHLPPGAATSTVQGDASAMTPAAKDKANPLPKEVLFGASLIVLIIALAWCWKLFRPT